MAKHQTDLGKSSQRRNRRSSGLSATRRLTAASDLPRFNSLSRSPFVEIDTRRNAFKRRGNEMAVVATVQGVSIVINYGYATPVFFAVTDHGQAMIELPTLNVIFNSLPQSQLDAVLAWARTRTAPLSREWTKTQSNLPVQKVD